MKDEKSGIINIEEIENQIFLYSKMTRYKNFAEMGGDLKLVVKYRGREITL